MANRFEKWVQPLTVEFVGTLIFAFTHSLAAQSVEITASAFSDGMYVTVMIIAVGPISGAHFNAAVTVALTLAGRLQCFMALLYIMVQLVGCLIGAFLAKVAFGEPTGYYAVREGYTVGQACLTEIITTFLLVFVILQAAVDFESPLAALAIGFTVIVDIFIALKISSACMNPSLSFGPAIVSGKWDNYWVYWVGPILGSLIAVALHKFAVASRKRRVFFSKEQPVVLAGINEDNRDETNNDRSSDGPDAL